MTIQAQILIALALLIGGIGIGWKLGVDSEKADQLDTVTDAVGQLAKDSKSSSAAGNEARAESAAQQVGTQAQTENGNETIRTVYRTITVAADCVQPDGVMQQLQSSQEAADSAVRASAGIAHPTTPERSRLSR